MLVNWFTVIAQALNFVVLVWLMKRFLYRPILDAIDTREKRIAAALADADSKKAEAEKALKALEVKTTAFDQDHEARLQKMKEDVESERQNLLSTVRQAAESDGSKHRDALLQDIAALQGSIGLRVQQEVFHIAHKALNDLAGVSIEHRMLDVFLQHLAAIDEPTKAALSKDGAVTTLPAVARSAFDLSEDQRQVIQNTLNETLSKDVPLQFETDPSLICGVAVSMNGQKVSWSLADYLAGLENSMTAFVEATIKKTKDADSKSSPLALSS
jgi:F-type H+-transporting ATPase subunit b